MRPALVGISVLAVIALFMIAGELHYQSCVQEKRLGVAAKYAVMPDHALLQEQMPDVSGCSRLP